MEDAPGLRNRGSISARLPGQGGSAAGQPAVTGYEVLARSAEGFAWLALQPVTGMPRAPLFHLLNPNKLLHCTSWTGFS